VKRYLLKPVLQCKVELTQKMKKKMDKKKLKTDD
jgi:hypothetical protein